MVIKRHGTPFSGAPCHFFASLFETSEAKLRYSILYLPFG